MGLRLNCAYLDKFVSSADINSMKDRVAKAHELLHTDAADTLGAAWRGWVRLPENYDKDEFRRIKEAAEKIQKNSEVLVVIGIGGSYLGARAAIEFVKSKNYNLIKKDTPDIYFAGNSISSSELAELLTICKDRDFSINVISKSGTTTEPAIAFRLFKALIEKKYGKEAKERIFVTTDKEKGTLKYLADREGYPTFVVPDDIGGRYSVLTAVGLLPLAVAGLDLDALMQGAADAMTEYANPNLSENDCYRYAAIRNILYDKGKSVEMFVSYEPDFALMNEWLKQLFGESEGKDGKGIFPAS
ncbi:MAG TPA: glucose-6-phosphate isomerase, partial [Clostridiales bacterium]|nr:glucose-6-phosphate isomerase [Clostridiales bacterium]